MKTYVRKRHQNQLIDNVTELCRLCLGREAEMVPIFNSEEVGVYTALVLRIMTCVGIEVTKQQNIPQTICLSCHREVDKIYAFRKKCELANKKIKSHFMALTDRDTSKAVLSIQNAEKAKDVDQNVKDTEKLVVVIEKDIKKENRDLDAIIKPLVVDKSDNNKDCDNSNKTISNNQIKAEVTTPVEECISSAVTSKLIGTGLFTSDQNILSLANSNVDLNNIIVELITTDNKIVTLELFEAEQSQKEMVVSDQIANTIINPVTVSQDNQRHIIIDMSNKRAPCLECGKTFASQTVLARHARVHSGERPFSCRRCERSFTQKEVLRRHELVHLDRKPFGCGSCGKSFTQRAALMVHRRSHAPPDARPLRLHFCKMCPKVFLYPSGLSRHMKVQHNGRTYACANCKRHFNDKTSLQRHLRFVHRAVVGV